MFSQAKNIDTAFKQIRTFSLLFLVCCTLICLYGLYLEDRHVAQLSKTIYVLANGKLLDAVAIDRADSLAIEIRDHVKMFHYYLFNLEPDDEAIKNSISKALYLADGSAKRAYDDLTESGYYTNLISGNISQKVEDADSIQVDLDRSPIHFRYYGKERIVRSTSVVMRSLITEGNIRITKISNKNPHGFLIERWAIVENKDLKTENR